VSTNAEFVRENNSFTSHVISQAIGTAVGAGSVVHFTVYAKNDGSNPVNYLKLKVSSGTNEIHGNFDLTGGNSPTSGSGGNGGDQLVATMEDAGNGWKRLRVSGVATTSGTSLTVGIYFQSSFGGGENYFGDGSSGANLWGSQLEAGNSVPTSYISTTSAATGRAADILSATSFTGFSGNFGDGTKWTSIVDFSRPYYEPSSSPEAPAAFTLCDSSGCDTDQIASVYSASTTQMGAQSVVSGSVQGGSYSGALTPGANTVYQLGAVKSSSALTAYLNGSAYTASGTLSFPAVDALYLGRNLSGHLRKFTIRARAVPSAEMQNLTND
jgi:hypothetical protein